MAVAEAEWEELVGGAGQDKADKASRRRGRRSDEAGSDDDGWDDDEEEWEEEWEEGVVLVEHPSDATFDIGLVSGEQLSGVPLEALDPDIPGRLGVGDSVWVDLLQIEWDEEEEDTGEEDDNQDNGGRGEAASVSSMLAVLILSRSLRTAEAADGNAHGCCTFV